MNRNEERQEMYRSAERYPESVAGQIVAQGILSIERYLDYVAAIDAAASIAPYTLDLRRWVAHPEVREAAGIARRALDDLYDVMREVIWEPMRGEES